MRPILVAIVGGSGSGKTHLAKQLQTALGRSAGCLSLDDFYRDRSHLASSRRARINFDHPAAIEWPLVERSLRSCLAGKVVHVPHYDFATHSRTPTASSFKPKPVVLVDGLWLFRRPALRRLFALRIFIDCPANTRLNRRLARDQRSRGRSAASVRQQFRSTVEPMHARYVAPQARSADVHLRGNWGTREVAALLRRISQLRLTTGLNPVAPLALKPIRRRS
jgi:uridine kinase